MADRLAENIRRIVGNDKQKANVLNTRPDKESIEGRRGASFAAAGSSGVTGTTTATGRAGQSMSGVSTGLVSGGYQYGSGGSGASIDPNDPNKAKIENGGNQFDVEDILDGDGPGFYDSNAEDGSGSDALNESVDAFTGMKDCATSKDLCIYTKNGIPPPDGWDDADVPPDGYYDGVITITTDGSGDGLRPYDWTQGEEWTADPTGAPTASVFSSGAAALDDMQARTTASGTLSTIEYEDVGFGRYRMTWVSPNFVELVTRSTCTPGSSSSCPIVEPNDIPIAKQPSDGCHALGFGAQGFESSRSENDADKVTKLMQRQSRVDFCFGVGRFGTIEVTKSGGYMMYETASEGGAISGIGTVFNGKGQATAPLADGNEVIQNRP